MELDAAAAHPRGGRCGSHGPAGHGRRPRDDAEPESSGSYRAFGGGLRGCPLRGVRPRRWRCGCRAATAEAAGAGRGRGSPPPEGADGASATGGSATSAPVDHASRTGWGRTVRPPRRSVHRPGTITASAVRVVFGTRVVGVTLVHCPCRVIGPASGSRPRRLRRPASGSHHFACQGCRRVRGDQHDRDARARKAVNGEGHPGLLSTRRPLAHAADQQQHRKRDRAGHRQSRHRGQVRDD